MGQRAEAYREELRRLQEWEPYLRKHSGLPGPRANLELVQAVGDEADPDRLWRFSASSDEFLAVCGTAGLGRVALMEPETVMTWLRELASDPRRRVREAVAMALQRIGRESMPHLIAQMHGWASGDRYVQRAAAAGLCEPALLGEPAHAVEVMAVLDGITASLASATERRTDGFRALRQALGYCWSIAVAAAPDNGRTYLEKWLQSTDKDVAWVMKSNLGKSRLDWLRAETTAVPAAPGHTARPKAQPAGRARSTQSPQAGSAAAPEAGARGSRRARPG